MDFIQNHFDITFDEKNIYYKSLLYNSDFDYLKDASIKIYESNPKVYNFLFEVQELIKNEEAYISNGELVLPIDNFMKEREDTNLSDFQYNLTLKEPVKFTLDIKSWGDIKYDTFKFTYNIQDKKYKQCEIVGCFAKKNENFYVLNKDLYLLFKAIDDITKIPNDENKEFNIWKTINTVKQQSSFTHSVLSGFFKNERIIIPSTMSSQIREDINKNIEYLVSLDGLTNEEQLAFQNEFQLPTAQDTYSINVNGEKTRIVVLPEIKENFEKLKKLPKTIRSKETKNKLVKNPTGIFPNKNVVSLDNLSDRIVNLGDYKAINSNVINNHQEWGYPFEIIVYDISSEKKLIKINDKNDKIDFTERLQEAIVNEYSYFEYNDISIPLTPQNFEVLKQFLENIQNERPKSFDKKIRNKVRLRNDKDEIVDINITDELFEDLKCQIKDIRALNTTDNIEWFIKIYDQQFPLTPENMKQIKEVFEIHFLIDEDLASLRPKIDELSYNSYCNVSVDIPKDLKYEIKLKKHQQKGLGWLQNSFKMREIGRTGALLADDMGLGKTLQLLSFIFWLKDNSQYFNTNNKKPVLIVAPVILLENWLNEYYKFFNDSLGRPLVLHGDTLRDLKIKEGKEHYQFNLSTCEAELHLDTNEIKKSNIVITNYDTLVNYEFSFASIDWSIVILDEAQEIKETVSHKSRVTKGLKADFKIACTGTPVENTLTDLWNIFDFLQPGTLGSKKEFNFEYNPETMDENKYQDLRNKLYYEKPYAYILRREKSIDLKDDLPQKYKDVYKVPLSDSQIIKYEELKRKMNLADTAEEKLIAFANMNKLSQHPRLLSNDANYTVDMLVQECTKFQELINVIENIKLKQEKVIIFGIFLELQKYLKLVLENKFNLENIDIINGSAKNRQKLIDKFQDKNGFNILILSPLAAGVGLNIVGANHVIHYGRWWNPAKENQATDRVYRIGQKKDVHVHYLIDIYPDNSEKTFDEKLHDLIMKKIEIAQNFLQPNDIDIEKEFYEEMQKDLLIIK